MVDDLIGLSASNHGTVDADGLCALGCAPAIWQQRSDAAFITALNSGRDTFPGISYTEIYTTTDEVVVPNSGAGASSAVHGGGGAITDVTIQQVCPADLTEHLGIGTYDATAYAIALDALTHAGPADPGRVPRGVCRQALMPEHGCGVGEVGGERRRVDAAAERPRCWAPPPVSSRRDGRPGARRSVRRCRLSRAEPKTC